MRSAISRGLPVVGLLFAFLPLAASAQANMAGLRIFGNDGTFLGAISCADLGNPYSRHGSKYSAVSIWNKYSQYGSPYSSLSAYNKYTSTPPVILNENGDEVGHLTANRFVAGAVSPIEVEAYLMQACDREDGYRE